MRDVHTCKRFRRQGSYGQVRDRSKQLSLQRSRTEIALRNRSKRCKKFRHRRISTRCPYSYPWVRRGGHRWQAGYDSVPIPELNETTGREYEVVVLSADVDGRVWDHPRSTKCTRLR